ncbi:HepT-like ribonuclease domain-containing protein [Sediminibacterium goheungense]|uniref:HepT-like ribonuclease domain-containing protein n=1 Tax=Sediminibacterium goheungense TaxID=1086393 RepID=UPI003CCC536C
MQLSETLRLLVKLQIGLPEEFKEIHNEIDWHKIRGFRNRIVHDYFGIDYSIVWNIKETFLPQMIVQLQKL